MFYVSTRLRFALCFGFSFFGLPFNMLSFFVFYICSMVHNTLGSVPFEVTGLDRRYGKAKHEMGV